MSDQELASRGERLAAYLFEVALALPFGLVSGVLGYRLGFAQARHLPLAPSLVFALALAAVCLTALTVVQMYWLATRGQTLGKRWMKIRFVRLDGSDPGFVHAVLWRGFLHMGVYLTLLLIFARVFASAYLLADMLVHLWRSEALYPRPDRGDQGGPRDQHGPEPGRRAARRGVAEPLIVAPQRRDR